MTMKLPASVSEADFIAATEKVINILASSFTFGYFTVEDIKQQARLFAIQAMDRYDPTRPLDNFLYSHIKNRLINFRRDNYRRNDPPCLQCHNSIDGETRHVDKRYCERYCQWLGRNTRKQNVMSPLDISNISDENEPTTRSESTVLEELEKKELLALIDSKLPVELRAVYLQMQSGESVSKLKRQQIERAVIEIIQDSIECLEPNR
jgi:RNA polymerase sigma factor (sigma-70 family)